MASPPHILLFPFMSKGHTIPLLHLARLLLHRNASVTIFTTPANHPFISYSLSDVKTTIINLPFPQNIPGIPSGIESTDKLPNISLWPLLATATKLMKPHFEKALHNIPSVNFMVTDGFLWWTIESAIEFDIPRLVYYGMSNFASTINRVCGQSGILNEIESNDELFSVPHFPWIKVTRNHFDYILESDFRDQVLEFMMNCRISTDKSYGTLINSFYELEQVFIDYSNLNFQSKQFCVGPLCLAEPPPPLKVNQKTPWIQWLDEKLEQGKSVMYVAFGSQAEISSNQIEEIKSGLEKSEVNFLWVIRKTGREFEDGFENRVKDRGLVVKEWVNQREILGHQSVEGFLSHCGWGSVIESICAKVPILAWPMMADQPLNATFVVEEIKIGIMVVDTCNGSVKGMVKSEGLEKSVKELMEGEMGKKVRMKVKEIGEGAVKAMVEGGSSWNELDRLLNELHGSQHDSTVKLIDV